MQARLVNDSGGNTRVVSRDSADFRVRSTLFMGWALGLVSLLNPQRAPFSELAVLAGILIATSGVLLASDHGRAMDRLNERFVPRFGGGPSYKVMAAAITLVGVVWMVLGVALSVT